MERIAHKHSAGKKKWLVILCSVALAIALSVTVIFHHYNVFREEMSVVTGISVRTVNEDTAELRIGYQFPCGGYSVRAVPEDEGEYIGDGMIDYDGSLGRYRILVEFGDLELSTALTLKFVAGETVMLKNAPLKLRAKIASPSDHGFVLYIGADQPISVDPLDRGTLNGVGGTVKILIAVGNE